MWNAKKNRFEGVEDSIKQNEPENVRSNSVSGATSASCTATPTKSPSSFSLSPLLRHAGFWRSSLSSFNLSASSRRHLGPRSTGGAGDDEYDSSPTSSQTMLGGGAGRGGSPRPSMRLNGPAAFDPHMQHRASLTVASLSAGGHGGGARHLSHQLSVVERRHSSRRDSSASSLGRWLAISTETRVGASNALSRYRSTSMGHSCPNLNFGSASATPHNKSPSCSSSNLSTISVIQQQQLQYPTATNVQNSSAHAVLLRKEIAGVQRRHSNRTRHSYHPNTSPKFSRCKSPVFHNVATASADVPHSSTTNSPPIAAFRPKLHGFDTRRWSLASLPSSGYGTPGSSAFSSQYSSQERLQLFGGMPPPVHHYHHYCKTTESSQQGTDEASGSPYLHYGSNDSNPNVPVLWDDGSMPAKITRPRSRSFNSLAWLNLNTKHGQHSMARSICDSGEVTLRNNTYKERFPKAKKQMEDKLRQFIAENQLNILNASASSMDETLLDPSHPKMSTSLTISCEMSSSPIPLKILSNGAARFLHNQIVELASDVLLKSDEDMLSSIYFYDMFQNLEDLLSEAKDKSPDSLQCLSELARKLLLIVSRTARLLECLEFDPDQFYRFLEEAECHAKEVAPIGQDIPQYIIKQLGLSHDTAEDAQPGLESQLSESGDVGESSLIPPNQSKLQPPKEDDFESIKLISNGAYGAVYLVRHVVTRRKFALKKLRKSNLALRNQIDQVYAERDILTFTDNPFVVSFFGSFETKRHLCMVMEYVEGGDCAALLKSIGVFPLDLARLYIAETVLAIEYLHSYGIVHRDLKPDNLLITALGHIKLTDFGLSKIGLMNRTNLLYEGCLDLSDTQQFQDRQICGTPEYIAPEVILMNGYGKPVDWWALGCILYEFLVGVVPFFGETPEELFSHVISDEIQWPEDPEDPPQVARDLIDQLLQQDPVDRIGTVNGAIEIRSHSFFDSLDWNSMLRQKAEFVPQLEGEDDTSYFDTRSDRYNHEVESDDDDVTGIGLDESVAFSSFSSCSPRFSHLNDPTQKTSDFGSSSLDSGPSSSSAECAPAYDGVILRRHSTQRLSIGGANMKQVTPHGGQSRKTTNELASQGNAQSSATVTLTKAAVSDSADHVLTQSSAHRRANTLSLPRLAISMDSGDQMEHTSTVKELSPVDEHLTHEYQSNSPAINRQMSAPAPSVKSKKIIQPIVIQAGRSTSPTKGLHLDIPSDTGAPISPQPLPPILTKHRQKSVGGIQSPGGSSTSSRDDSPHRRGSLATDSNSLLPMIALQKPPIALKKGAKGYGFTFKTIRVYLGQSEYYTIQHIVTLVENDSPATKANLEPDDLITHVNNIAVQNMPHPQVVQLMLSSGDTITLRVSPLDQTSIKQGGGQRPSVGKLARRKGYKQKMQRKALEKKNRKSSLFRRLSGKRANAELNALGMACGHALGAAVLAPAGLTPASLVQRSMSTCEALGAHGGSTPALALGAGVGNQKHSCGGSGGTSVNILRAIGLSPKLTHGDSSSSSSPVSSVPNSPASPFNLGLGQSRPSTLHGLTSKLTRSFKSPTRRKNTQGIPLSPLARTEQNLFGPASASSSAVLPSTAPIIASADMFNAVITNPLFSQIEAADVTSSTPVKSKKSSSPHNLMANVGSPRRLSSGAGQICRSPSPLAMDNVEVAENVGPSLKTITRPRKSSEKSPNQRSK